MELRNQIGYQVGQVHIPKLVTEEGLVLVNVDMEIRTPMLMRYRVPSMFHSGWSEHLVAFGEPPPFPGAKMLGLVSNGPREIDIEGLLQPPASWPEVERLVSDFRGSVHFEEVPILFELIFTMVEPHCLHPTYVHFKGRLYWKEDLPEPDPNTTLLLHCEGNPNPKPTKVFQGL